MSQRQRQAPKWYTAPVSGILLVSRWLSVAGAAGVLILLGLLAFGGRNVAPLQVGAHTQATDSPHTTADFVGGEACAACHGEQHRAWKGSLHRRSMQEASVATVLGDFDGATFSYAGVTSTFFKRDGRFFVRTDGPEGQLHTYEIQYTFGVTPLQQYLIAFPDGRLQALSIAWDARPKVQGGDRWFHLYPQDRVTHEDELHWTRRGQNWNWMCADCHSTNLRRNYDAVSDRYQSTWSEINVSCEACHGPGSRHVDWAEKRDGWQGLETTKGLAVALDERQGISWRSDTPSGNAVRSAPLTTHREVEACAQCHARRAPFADGLQHGTTLMETQDPALLRDGLYFADGQQQDEVYTYGSFLQSRMYARGVTCADCHDPHAGRMRAQGNGLCARCHVPKKYDVREHTLHAVGTKGAQCVACHMPTRTYMQIDARHDHSLRVPRPDVSARLGTPNACNACHRDRSAAWAAGVVERAFGPVRKGYQGFATALHAGRAGERGAEALLTALANDAAAPAIARASAVAELENYPGPNTLATLNKVLTDTDPLLRGAALDTLLRVPPSQRATLAMNLLDDPVRVVRVKTARALASVSLQGLPPAQRVRLERAFADYLASQLANAERPEAHLNLGLFRTDRGQLDAAEREYRAALRLDAGFVPAYINLADLYRALGREADAESALLAGARHRPDDGDLAYALGLFRVRQGRHADAVHLLAQAARRKPDNPRYAYVAAVALHDDGRLKDARTMTEQALRRFPNDRELLVVAMEYARDARDHEAAARWAGRLAALTFHEPLAAP